MAKEVYKKRRIQERFLYIVGDTFLGGTTLKVPKGDALEAFRLMREYWQAYKDGR